MSTLGGGLPAFFQTSAKTVLDELADFELGGDLEDDGVPLEGEPVEDRDQDTFGDIGGGFGDLKADNLPDFFKNPSQREQENYDILDAMANQTLDDDVDFDSVSANLPPGARISTAYPQTHQPPAQTALPPGLAPASKPSPSAAAVNYKDLLAAMGNPAPAAPQPVPVSQTTARGPPISYAGAVAPSAQNQPPSDATPAGPPGMGFNSPPPPPGVAAGPAGSFISAHPAYVLNPHLPSPPAPAAGVLRGVSASTVHSAASGATQSTTGFSAQKPLLYNSSTGFSTPSGAAPTGNYHGTAPQYRKELPKGKFMAPSDVRFVVNKVLAPMESTDPFADDFYFLQMSIKKNAAAREAALKEQRELPKPIYVPLPVWKETKERIRMQMDITRRGFHERSREWEQKEQVLGHQVRSDIHRPREQLSMPSMADLDFGGDDEAGEGELRSPFSSRLWTMRRAVQRGYEALYTVQELQHLLSSPLIAANPAAHAEICREIDSAIALLSQSLGIRSSTSPTPSTHPGSTTDSEIALDGGHVGAILQTAIGRKLMTRSLKLLSPPHRWALLPVILAKILLSPPAQDPPSSNTGAAPTGNEALAVEQRLLRTIIEFLQYSYQFQIDQQRQVPPGAVAVFTNVLLSNLRQCIKSVMVTQMEKSKLRQALISERTRAEVMHMIVQIGDKVRLSADARLAEEWVQTREAFMSMLDN